MRENLPSGPDAASVHLAGELCARLQALAERPAEAMPVPGLTVSCRRGTDGGPCSCLLYRPSVTVIASGRKRSIVGERVYEYGAGDVFVTALDMPATWQVLEASDSVPFAAVSVPLEREILREFMPMVPPCPGSDCPQAALTGRSDTGILDAFLRLVRLEPGVDAEVLGPLIVREIHWRVLSGIWGEGLRRFFTSDSQSARIDSAVQWLRENFREPPTVEALAERVHMAPSTFYRHFRAVTSLSPLQYQKQLRLHEARRLMLVRNLDAASAAYSVGYVSPTQFSREFRRLFGQSPRKSMAGFRESAPAAPL